MSWKIGVKIGGAVIDFCALDTRKNEVNSLKVLTTPDDSGSERRQGPARLAKRHGLGPAQVETFVHQATRGNDTVIQRRDARPAPVTHAGFDTMVAERCPRHPQIPLPGLQTDETQQFEERAA